MRRTALIRTIEGSGCVLVRHGAKHDFYKNPKTGKTQTVPRHREVGERLANDIIRALGNPSDDQPAPNPQP